MVCDKIAYYPKSTAKTDEYKPYNLKKIISQAGLLVLDCPANRIARTVRVYVRTLGLS